MHTKHLWLLLDLNGSYFDALCRHVYILMSAGSKNVLHQSTDPNTVGDPSLSLSPSTFTTIIPGGLVSTRMSPF